MFMLLPMIKWFQSRKHWIACTHETNWDIHTFYTFHIRSNINAEHARTIVSRCWLGFELPYRNIPMWFECWQLIWLCVLMNPLLCRLCGVHVNIPLHLSRSARKALCSTSYSKTVVHHPVWNIRLLHLIKLQTKHCSNVSHTLVVCCHPTV